MMATRPSDRALFANEILRRVHGWCPKIAWARVAVDQRRHHVHQQDRKGHAVRVGAPAPDDQGDDADAGAEYQAAAWAGAAADRVGCDEKGSERSGRRKIRAAMASGCCPDPPGTPRGPAGRTLPIMVTGTCQLMITAPQQPQPAQRVPVGDPLPAQPAEVTENRRLAGLRNHVVRSRRWCGSCRAAWRR